MQKSNEYNSKETNKESQDPLVVVLVGGLGTRLGEKTKNTPKPMIEIAGAPMLEHTVKHIKACGFSRFLFKQHYLPEIAERHFGDGSQHGADIAYITFEENLDTAGGLSHLKDESSPIFVIYGDELFDIDPNRLLAFHHKRKSDATLLVFETTHPKDSDIVTMDGTRVVDTTYRPNDPSLGNLANAALYVFEPLCFGEIPEMGAFDFGRELIPLLIKKGYNVHGYKLQPDEYMEDAGTPDRFKKVEQDILSGTLTFKKEYN